MTCNGVCVAKHGARRCRLRSNGGARGGYSAGEKKCATCQVSIKSHDQLCPCCGYKLRTKARGGSGRRKLVAGAARY